MPTPADEPEAGTRHRARDALEPGGQAARTDAARGTSGRGGKPAERRPDPRDNPRRGRKRTRADRIGIFRRRAGRRAVDGLLADREGLLPPTCRTPVAPLVSKLGYTVGFLIVVLGRQQLFTENTLTPVLPLLQNRTANGFGNVLRLWGVVLAANVARRPALRPRRAPHRVFDPRQAGVRCDRPARRSRRTFGTTFVPRDLRRWLIALMVWLLPFAESARLWVIIILTYVVGLGGFRPRRRRLGRHVHVAATGETAWATSSAGTSCRRSSGTSSAGSPSSPRSITPRSRRRDRGVAAWRDDAARGAP